MTVKHLDDCPKERKIEKRDRVFVRKGDQMVSHTERCPDCGARHASKARKVNPDG